MVDAAGVMARDALPALKQGGAVASSQRDEAGDHQQPDQEDRVQQGPGLPAQQQQHAGESEGQQQQQAVPVLEPQLPVALQHPAAAAAAEPAGALETAAPVPLGAIPLGTIGSLGGTLPVGAVPLGAIPLGPVGLPLGAGAAPDAAAGPKGHHSSQSLTFAWLGEPHVEGSRIYYGSFSFCDTRFDLGDHVYLIPEDAGAPLYLGRVTAAYEDDTQQGGDRLCIEVQWYERRANMPPHLQPGMHDREVVECMQQTDTNLVGCIERKARVIKARSYEEAVAQLTHQEAAGEWHFCRGVLEVESEVFRTYEEVAADPSLTFDQRNGMVVSLAAAASAAASCVSRPEPMHLLVPGAPLQPMALQLFQPAEPAGKRGGGKGGRRGGGGGGGGRRGGRQARAFTGNAHGGVPGEICYECGATSTPQWREGPMGPRTLCNACGMRYQRSQGKGVNRPRRTGSGDGTGSGGPERKSARTTRGRGRGKGRYSSRYDDPFDDEDDEDSADLELTDDDD